MIHLYIMGLRPWRVFIDSEAVWVKYYEGVNDFIYLSELLGIWLLVGLV